MDVPTEIHCNIGAWFRQLALRRGPHLIGRNSPKTLEYGFLDSSKSPPVWYLCPLSEMRDLISYWDRSKATTDPWLIPLGLTVAEFRTALASEEAQQRMYQGVSLTQPASMPATTATPFPVPQVVMCDMPRWIKELADRRGHHTLLLADDAVSRTLGFIDQTVQPPVRFAVGIVAAKLAGSVYPRGGPTDPDLARLGLTNDQFLAALTTEAGRYRLVGVIPPSSEEGAEPGTGDAHPDIRHLPLTPNFKLEGVDASARFGLVLHKPTGESRWVLATAIRDDGIAVAFYDADPTYMPASEHRY